MMLQSGEGAYTMATPATTVKMLAMMERLKTLPSHTLSTPHTKGMISSFAICIPQGEAVSPVPLQCKPEVWYSLGCCSAQPVRTQSLTGLTT